jgi:hypothetical protein
MTRQVPLTRTRCNGGGLVAGFTPALTRFCEWQLRRCGTLEQRWCMFGEYTECCIATETFGMFETRKTFEGQRRMSGNTVGTRASGTPLYWIRPSLYAQSPFSVARRRWLGKRNVTCSSSFLPAIVSVLLPHHGTCCRLLGRIRSSRSLCIAVFRRHLCPAPEARLPAPRRASSTAHRSSLPQPLA